MLNFYDLKSSINNSNIVVSNNRIVTIEEARDDFEKKSIHETFMGSAGDFIKSIFRKIKEFILKMYYATFGKSSKGKSGGSSSGGYSGSGSSSTSDRSPQNNYNSRRTQSSYNTSDGWSASDADLVRRKLNNPYFAEHFIWELHNWDNGYLYHISDNADKLDAVRIRLPGGRKIDSSITAITDEIENYIKGYNATDRVPKDMDTYVSYFKNDVHKALERIYGISDGESYQSQIYDRITGGGVRKFRKSDSEIMSMVRLIEDESIDISAIEARYCKLIDEIESAEAHISAMNLDSAPEEVVNVVSALSHFLQYKVAVITAIEHIHIKALNDRSAEYKSELRRFNNM